MRVISSIFMHAAVLFSAGFVITIVGDSLSLSGTRTQIEIFHGVIATTVVLLALVHFEIFYRRYRCWRG